jgi:hypothetical protein
MTKGLDFMLKDIGPKDKMPVSEDEPQESGVMTRESRVESQGKGDQLQDPGILCQESRVMTPESLITASEEKGVRQESRVGLPETGVVNQESGVVTDDIIGQAVTQALKSPKISLYSPLLLAVLESQQLMLLNRREATLLQYRKSTKARELVENALREAYPDLCEKIQKRINEGNGEK